jgi:hypothetical protein
MSGAGFVLSVRVPGALRVFLRDFLCRERSFVQFSNAFDAILSDSRRLSPS